MSYMKDALGRRLDSLEVMDKQTYRDTVFRGLPVVTTRGNGFGANNSLSNGTDTSATFRSMHVVQVSSSEIRLVFSNFYQGDSVGPNPITVGASVEQPAAAAYASTVAYTNFWAAFNGQDTVTIKPGGYAVSDPIPLVATAGQVLYVRTYVQVAASGQKWPTTMYSYPNTYEGVTAGSDLRGSGAAIATANVPMYSPLAIVGTPNVGVAHPKVWGFSGDSILFGSGDNTHQDLGYGVRAAVAAGRPYINASRPGETAQAVGPDRSVSTLQFTRQGQLAACTDVLEAYGQNDIADNYTLAQIQVAKIAIWQRYAARGVRVWTQTVGPQTTSTDGWSTLAGQTVTSTQSVRVALNAWIRDGAPILNGVAVATGSDAAGTVRMGHPTHPVVGFFEVANTIESAPNSGLWAVPNVRIVNDAAMTASSDTLTSATAAFTTADVYSNVAIAGAGASGAYLVTHIAGFTSATQVKLATAASTTVSAARCGIGVPTQDGIHPSPQGHAAMATALTL